MGAVKHGDSISTGKTRLYRIYNKMRARCYSSTQHGYEYYGGKGIKICPEWNGHYIKFREWALTTGYTDSLTIDRIDNNKNYSPANCRWISQVEQLRNRSNTIKYNGEMSSETSRRLGGARTLVNNRIKLGWSLEDAFTIPNKGRVSKETQREILKLLEKGSKQKDIAKMFKLNQATISRIKNKLCS